MPIAPPVPRPPPEQGHDILDGRGLAEEAAELVLAEMREDRLDGVEMELRLVLRRHEEEDRVDGLLVEAVEVNPCAAHADRRERRLHRGGLGVGDGHPVVEARGALVLAGDDRLGERVAHVGRHLPARDERIEQLLDRIIALGGGQVGDDGLLDDDFSEFHGVLCGGEADGCAVGQ